MRGKAHSDEVKARVMAALLQGQGATEIAKQYELNEATVRNWKRSLEPARLTEVNEKKKDEFSELVATYLREVLVTLSVQVRHARDPEWLKGQDAAGLGVFHGILTDKAIRILEAAERAAALERGRLPVDP